MKSRYFLHNFLLLSWLVLGCLCLALLATAQENVADNDYILHLINADFLRYDLNGSIHAKGNVQAAYGDYTVSANEFVRNPSTNMGIFEGHVRLATKQASVEGERLEIDVKTRKWALYGATSRLDPSVFQGQTSAPVFIGSSVISGDERNLAVRAGTLTTCDLEHPHYYFSAKEIEIHPDSKIVARNVSIIGLDKRLFSLSSLVIPVRGLSHNLLPQVGSSAEEGLFLKTAYAYLAKEHQQGFLKLDLMQKRGVGAGIEHSYNAGPASGQLTLYYLDDREIGGRNISGRLQHQQRLGTVNLSVATDYITNSYLYFPSTTTSNWQLALSQVRPNANTALTFRANEVSGMGQYETSTASLRHSQQFNEKLSGVLSLDMKSYRSLGMTTDDRELDSVVEIRHQGDKYDLALNASRRTDLDGNSYTGDDSYSSLDRLPELAFETDTYRSGLRLLGLPSRLLVSAGRYHEEPSGVSSDRVLLQWDMLGQTVNLGSRTDLSLTAGFRQALYAKDKAQYVLRLGGVLTATHNDYMKTRITYNYQQPEGYSPFLFDYTGRYNYVRLVTDYQDTNKLRWSLSGGYDLNQRTYPWQDLSLRLTARPSNNVTYSFSTGYDLNRGKWRTLVGRFQVAGSEQFGLDVGARYDIENSRVQLARGKLKIPIGDKWRLEGIASWNGASKAFDYKAFRLTRDLHCWEASLVYNEETGFRTDRALSLELRVKAFPTVDRFGIGQYGQAVDTSMGEYYY